MKEAFLVALSIARFLAEVAFTVSLLAGPSYSSLEPYTRLYHYRYRNANELLLCHRDLAQDLRFT